MAKDGIVIIEQQVICCLWDNPSLTLRFEKNYFLSQIGKAIYDSIHDLYVKNVEVNAENIFAIASQKERDVSEELLQDLKENTSYALESFDHYFSVLKKRYAKDSISYEVLQGILKESEKKTDDLDLEKLRSLSISLQDNIELIEGKTSVLMTLEDMFNVYDEAIHNRLRGDHVYSTGDSLLDSKLAMGFAPGQVSTLFAATGVGKSVFGLTLVNKQINKSIPSIYVSLEMDTISTMDRLISMRTRIPTNFFYPDINGDIEDEAFESLKSERKKLENNRNFFFVEDPSLSLSDIDMIIREAQRKSKQPYFIVTIDLLTMLKDFSGKDPKQYEEGMNKLHEIAKKNRVHILGIVQANRDADSANVHLIDNIHRLRPSLNNIKNSGAIAERSRIVLSAFRERYYAERLFPEAPELDTMDDVLEIQILKQSMGEIGFILKYLYDGSKYLLYPFVEDEE